MRAKEKGKSKFILHIFFFYQKPNQGPNCQAALAIDRNVTLKSNMYFELLYVARNAQYRIGKSLSDILRFPLAFIARLAFATIQISLFLQLAMNYAEKKKKRLLQNAPAKKKSATLKNRI